MFALADVNSFYASCETVFRPDLKRRPVCVASNNDGCVIARNALCKHLGIKMGTPLFQIKHLIKQHNIVVFSSNYALYADLSQRVMTVLEALAPKVEVYSIDEAWMQITGINATMPYEAFGHLVRDQVYRHTGLTVGVGCAPTKTLAKACNFAAKTWPATKGVVALTDPLRIRKLLTLMATEDVWGIGRRLSKTLNTMGIQTALQLADLDVRFARKHFGVVLERTVRELRGESCISLEEHPPVKQQIICSRSFGQRIQDEQAMSQAVCRYAERAAEKLRQEKQYCRHITVFIRTSPYADDPQYGNAGTEKLLTATQDTRDIVAAAQRILTRLWRPGFRYAKAGVILNDFSPNGIAQLNLFDEHAPRPNSDALMQVIDQINHNGLGRVWFAGQGIEPVWQMKREMLSPAYTTRWADLPRARF